MVEILDFVSYVKKQKDGVAFTFFGDADSQSDDIFAEFLHLHFDGKSPYSNLELMDFYREYVDKSNDAIRLKYSESEDRFLLSYANKGFYQRHNTECYSYTDLHHLIAKTFFND